VNGYGSATSLCSLRRSGLPRVLAILVIETGCEAIRIKTPFMELRRHGWAASWVAQEHLEKLDTANYDVIVLPRLTPLDAERAIGQVRALQEIGKVVIFEMDDDYTTRTLVGPENRKWLEEIWRTVDAITVSTPYLRKVMLDYNPEVYTLPNCNNAHFWDPVADPLARVDPVLTIGLAGGNSHYDDWKLCYPGLCKIVEEYPDIKVLFGGFLPQYYKEDLPADSVIYQPGVHYNRWPLVVRQVDIGLAPVTNDPFNLCKSAQKLLDYWSSARDWGRKRGGCAVVASDHPIYRRVASKKNCILAKGTEGWYDAIKSLIEDSQLRATLAVNGYKWIRKNRDVTTQWRLWGSLYQKLWRRKHS
jgi:glycosyltransferase involved in cell wall biosynthesis